MELLNIPQENRSKLHTYVDYKANIIEKNQVFLSSAQREQLHQVQSNTQK
jgi:hypothetical protein